MICFLIYRQGGQRPLFIASAPADRVLETTANFIHDFSEEGEECKQGKSRLRLTRIGQRCTVLVYGRVLQYLSSSVFLSRGFVQRCACACVCIARGCKSARGRGPRCHCILGMRLPCSFLGHLQQTNMASYLQSTR